MRREKRDERRERERGQTNCLTVGRIIRLKFQNLTRVFNYLQDSNFRPAGINSELIKDRTVWEASWTALWRVLVVSQVRGLRCDGFSDSWTAS